MTMIAQITGAVGCFLRRLLSYTTFNENLTPEEDFGVYKVNSDSSKYFVKYPTDAGIRVSSLTSEALASWLCVHYHEEDFSRSKLKKIIFNLENTANYYRDSIPECKLFSRVGYDEKENGEEKVYVCLHNKNRDVVEITTDGWQIISEDEAASRGVLFENPGYMTALFSPEKGGNLKEIREFVNVNDEDFCLVLGWLLVTLMPSRTMDCPILWINAPKGTGKTTATKFLKRLIDPDAGGTISPVGTTRDFAASLSSRYIVGVDNVSRIGVKMSDVYCRAVTGDTLSRRKLFSDNTVNNVNLHGHLMINGMNYAPARSDLQDRCFQIKLRRLSEKTRKSNEELERRFQERGPYILGALFDALSSVLKLNRKDVPELGVDVRMKDACQFIMKVAQTGALPFSGDEFRKVLKTKKEEAEASDKSLLYDNAVLSLICDMTEEKYKDNSNCEEVVVWNDATGKLLNELKKRALAFEKSGLKGMSKDIPSSPQKLGGVLTKYEKLLSEEAIYLDRTRTGKRRITRLIYKPFDDNQVPQTAQSIVIA